MILGFPRAKQGLCHTKHGGAGGIILWALLTVFLVLLQICQSVYLFCDKYNVQTFGYFAYAKKKSINLKITLQVNLL